MLKRIAVFILILTLMLLFSCSQKQIIKHYYLLDVPYTGPADTAGFSTSLPYTVQILPFEISKAFDQNRIALRTKSNQIEYYYYNFWATDPGTAVREFIFHYLRSSHLFRNISLQLPRWQPDFFLNGSIEQIERLSLPDQSSAHLKMQLWLSDRKSGAVLVEYRFDRYEPLRKNAAMNIFAAKISRILGEELGVFGNRIRQYFTKQAHP